MAYLTVQCPFEGIEVVHAVAGRIRLRSADKGSDGQLEDLAKFLQRQPAIKQVRPNPQTGSLTATFDAHQLPMQQLLTLLSNEGVTVPQTASTPALLNDPIEQVSNLIAGASFDAAMPLMAGLLVVQRLGIQGLPALPLYLIVAESTRQVLDEYGSILQPASPPVEFASEPTAESGFEIVHAVAGRIRFHIPRIVEDEIYRRRLKRAIEALPEVTGIKVNKTVASFAVTYDPRAVSLPQMQRQLVNQIKQSSIPVSIQVPGAKPKNPPIAKVAHPSISDQSAQPTSVAKNERPVNVVKPSVVSFSTPTAPTPKKPTAWDHYKPPALSIFLNFMANLY